MSKAMMGVRGSGEAADMQMPSVGLGLWKVGSEKLGELIYEAIRVGYRHLDSACDYGNESEVGEGLQRALAINSCQREDLWGYFKTLEYIS